MDLRTLTAQRFEAHRLLSMLTASTPVNMMSDPAVKMWRDYPMWVATFGVAVCLEWEGRSERSSQLTKFFIESLDVMDLTDPYPFWLGDPVLHLSHRSNMIRLAPDHYQKLWPGVVEGIPLVYPTYEKEQE